MAVGRTIIVLCMLLGVGLSVSQYYSDYRQSVSAKKGLTFQATVWPE